MNWLIYSLLATTVWLTTSIAFIEKATADIRFERLLMSSGQADKDIGAITSIAQDLQGFIWLAGENGVLRYDGMSSKHYIYDPTRPSLTSNYARNILVDNEGVVWVGTDLGLCYHDPMIDNFRCYNHDARDPHSISDNTIFSLINGPDNSLYIGTSNGLSILGPDRKRFTRHFTDNDTISLKSISSLMLEKHQLWLGTSDNGFGIFNLNNSDLQLFPFVANSISSVNFPHVRSFLRHSDEEMWVSTYGGGLSLFNINKRIFSYYRHDPSDVTSLAGDVVWHSFRDSAGTAWFATDHGGLSRYDPITNAFSNFSHNPYDPNSLASNQVRVIFEDSSHNLWFGNFPHGISYWDRSAQTFTHWINKAGNNNTLSHSAILSFLQDDEGTIWIGTENGLNAYNPRTKTFTNFLPRPGDPNALQAGSVLSLEQDTFGNIWVGTWAGGLYKFDPDTHVFKRFGNKASGTPDYDGHFIWKIIEDHSGLIWIASENNGLSVYDPDTNKIKKYFHDKNDPNSISSSFVLNILEDSRQNLWVATTNGFDRFDRKKEVFRRYKTLFDQTVLNTQNVGTTRYRSIHEDNDGNIWIGTQNNGIFILDPMTDAVRQMDISAGLPSNFVASIILDKNNTIWAATTSGVAKIDPTTFIVREVLTTKSGLAGNNHNRDASLIDDLGNIYFGSIDGVTIFNPVNVNFSQASFPVVLKDFKVLNKSVIPGDEGSPLKKPLAQTDHIVLTHEHSMITFEYAALNYQAPRSMQYAYRLKGFDKDWNYVGDKTFATYTNLNHGRYAFEVKSRPQSKDWLIDQARVQLTVLPPPWRTWWSYSFYLLCSLALLGFFIRLHFRRVEFNAQRSLNRELIKLNKIKDAFLANTSHELRTPLNGIIGIAESVVEEAQSHLSDSLKNKLELIAVSGKRLSGLINDILDYTKLGHSKLIILPKATNLHASVNDVFALLQPLADEKGLELHNQVSPTTSFIFADENRLQQILINLVGNSIKFTDKGEVRIDAYADNKMMQVSVKDTGIGIAKDQIEYVFDIFQQADNSRNQGGTGLGLAVTRELVELHGGKMSVTSQEGVGSCFSFSIPLYNPITSPAPSPVEHRPLAADKQVRLARPLNLFIKKAPVANLAISSAPVNAASFTILVVDDDAINRMVLKSMLELHRYQVLEAIDGIDALTAVENYPVDLIILDLMMPRLDGFSVCRRLRAKFKIHELPIILLTAKKVDEDVAHGFAAGANEFLTKPVSKYELLPRIGNHIHLLSIYRQFSGRN